MQPKLTGKTGMNYKSLRVIFITIAVLVGVPGWTPPVFAQPVLIESQPAADALLSGSPETVSLTFDRALEQEGTWVEVTNEAGDTFNAGRGQVGQDIRAQLVVEVTPLPEGRYRVSYNAVGIGGSTVAVGFFEFTIDLPEPRLVFTSPVDGAAFTEAVVPLQFEVQYFDFGLYNNRIKLYVDGNLIEELRALDYTVEGLSPGVHRIQATLARFDDEDLPDTTRAITIAIAQPDIEQAGREAAAVAPPDPGLRLTIPQWIGVIVLSALLLGAGIWLGGQPGSRR
jgi:hypothetical protein